MAYFKNISTVGKLFYPSLLWNKPDKSKTLYLTFDDGPHPAITPWVLNELKKHQAKATFFCVGENIDKFPEVVSEIIKEGHNCGNHTYNHLNGWKTPNVDYLANISEAEAIMKEQLGVKDRNKLFRPPYGKIKPSQIKALQKLNYTIVMWDVLSADFDAKISIEQCYKNVVELGKPGSIVVFHDSIKASEKLKEVLPRVLDYFSGKGYHFKAL